MGNIHTIGPNKALVVSGGCKGGKTKKVLVIGGWCWAWWLLTDVQSLSLEVMTVYPFCENVETLQGVALNVTGVAQCKIMKEDTFLMIAAEHFLGKTVEEVRNAIRQTLDGHLRAILGTLTVEEAYKDREKFAIKVRKVAAPDVSKMGIEILSFTIRDLWDSLNYMYSLGKAQTAAVKRDASIGVAQAMKDAGIREAECEKMAMDVKYSTDTKIENNRRLYELQKAQFDKEINTARAEAELAYELQVAKIRQQIRNEEIQIDVVERKKDIEIEEKEVLRKEKELKSLIRLPAEAESYEVQTIADGKRTETLEAAKAQGERIRLIGAAEATAIENVGKADAELRRLKAVEYKKFGDMAMMEMVLQALPKITSEVTAPLSKIEEIVVLGGSDQATDLVNRIVAQATPSIKALTGIHLPGVFSKKQ